MTACLAPFPITTLISMLTNATRRPSSSATRCLPFRTEESVGLTTVHRTTTTSMESPTSAKESPGTSGSTVCTESNVSGVGGGGGEGFQCTWS